MKKILIIYASAGDGHKKAAEAVYNAILDLNKEGDIKAVSIDSLNYTSKFFKYCYKVGYMVMIKYMPAIWGLFYYILDNRFFFTLNKPFRRLTNAVNAKRLVRLMLKEKFDAVISTHFLGTEVISNLKKRGLLSTTLINIITDFKPHLFWEGSGVDKYLVAADSTKKALAERGISQDKIKVTGIPIRKRFNNHLTKTEARKMLKADPDKFTIFIMGGGFGVGPIRETLLSLQDLDIDCQIVVVCGHNRKLFRVLNSLKGEFRKPSYIFGFIRNIDEIMTASDLMISKVGGITVSETLSKALPLLTINPIPGQESRNAEFLSDNGVGFRLKSIDEINETIKALYNSPERRERLRSLIRRLSRPSAAEDIAKFTIKGIK